MTASAVARIDDAMTSQTAEADRAYGKVERRIVPFLCIGFMAAYVDRVNVGFAKLQMLSDLRMSETVFGLGAGLFFLGYILCEAPSNLLLIRVGPRTWIARIMLTWGLLSGLMTVVHGPPRFAIPPSGCSARSIGRCSWASTPSPSGFRRCCETPGCITPLGSAF